MTLLRQLNFADYSSSSHRNVEHAGHVNLLGRSPSSNSICPQGPHMTVHFFGSSSVMSTLYMTRPASGSCAESGFQLLISSSVMPFSDRIDMPRTNNTMPLMPTVPAIDMMLATVKKAPATRHIAPAIRKFSLVPGIVIPHLSACARASATRGICANGTAQRPIRTPPVSGTR